MAPDPKHLDDPFDTSDELMAEAAAMEARAAQRRQDSIADIHEQITPKAIQHNTEERAIKLAEHEAVLARADAKDSRGRAIAAVDESNVMLAKADALEAAGDLAGASELREEAAGTTEFAQRQVAQAEASEAAATAAEAQAKVHVQREQVLQSEATKDFERSGAEERGADEMERSAGVMRNAGTQMTEAERLEAAAIDLRSRGVEGVERIDAAAKTARDEAEVLTLRARQQDPSHSFGTTDDNGIDPNLIEIEPNTPESPAGSDDLGIDQDLIEIEPNAAADGGDASFTDEAAAAGEGFSGDGFSGDGFADQGFEEPAAATQDFGMETFDSEATDGGGDFASSEGADEGFESSGDGGFEDDFGA